MIITRFAPIKYLDFGKLTNRIRKICHQQKLVTLGDLEQALSRAIAGLGAQSKAEIEKVLAQLPPDPPRQPAGKKLPRIVNAWVPHPLSPEEHYGVVFEAETGDEAVEACRAWIWEQAKGRPFFLRQNPVADSGVNFDTKLPFHRAHARMTIMKEVFINAHS